MKQHLPLLEYTALQYPDAQLNGVTVIALPLLIVDDGGFLIQKILKDGDLAPHVLGALELTSSGYHRLSKLSLPFPVVNVARSQSKLDIEAPLIGKLVVSHIQNYFHETGLANPRNLIIGGGPVGVSIRDTLQRFGHSAYIFDVDSQKSDIHSYIDRLSDFEVIIGATGSMPFPQDLLDKLSSTSLHLISASSSDREFTFALILAGAFESLKSRGAGFKELPEHIQKKINWSFASLRQQRV